MHFPDAAFVGSWLWCQIEVQQKHRSATDVHKSMLASSVTHKDEKGELCGKHTGLGTVELDVELSDAVAIGHLDFVVGHHAGRRKRKRSGGDETSGRTKVQIARRGEVRWCHNHVTQVR